MGASWLSFVARVERACFVGFFFLLFFLQPVRSVFSSLGSSRSYIVAFSGRGAGEGSGLYEGHAHGTHESAAGGENVALLGDYWRRYAFERVIHTVPHLLPV